MQLVNRCLSVIIQAPFFANIPHTKNLVRNNRMEGKQHYTPCSILPLLQLPSNCQYAVDLLF